MEESRGSEQSIFIEVIMGGDKGKGTGDGEMSEMDLEKLDSKLAVDVKTRRAAVGQKSSGFRLTERDLELLGFLLDQKFASLELR